MEIEAALKALKETNKSKIDGQNQDFLSQNRQLQIGSSDDAATEILAEIEVELQVENNEEFSNEIFLEKLDLNVTPSQDLKADIPSISVVPVAQGAKPQNKIYTCQLCNNVFTIFSNLKTHFSSAHNIETFGCNICVQLFWVEEAYKKHKCGIQQNNYLKRKMVSHKEDSIKNKENVKPKLPKKIQMEKSLGIPEGYHWKNYSCRLCSAKFALTKNLKNHFRDNHRIDIYDCDICHKIFVAKNLMEIHSKIHKSSLSTPLVNKILSAKKYPYSNQLTKIRSVKTIKCKICKEKFLTKLELQNHKNIIHSESTELNEKNSVLEEINKKSPSGSGIKTYVQDVVSNILGEDSEMPIGMELKIIDIDIAPDQTIHVIFYKGKKYITSAEASAMIPKFKGRDVLQKMLQLHKMEIHPFVAKKETCKELFEECIIEGVAGIENDTGEVANEVLLYELSDLPKIFDRFISEAEANPELIQTYLRLKNFM